VFIPRSNAAWIVALHRFFEVSVGSWSRWRWPLRGQNISLSLPNKTRSKCSHHVALTMGRRQNAIRREVVGRLGYVQPRNKKISSNIGMGIPRSQSRMYPVAPACLIFWVKRI
jgi:hypothetical protein